MKTTSLPEILKQITPLPWVESARIILSVETQVASINGPNRKDRQVERDSNAAYLTHAANVLPGLVEALRECSEMLAVAMNAEKNPFGIYHNQATDAIRLTESALSLATNVPVNS